MTLKKKIFLAALVIGVTPLIMMFIINYMPLHAMKKAVEKAFGDSLSAFQNIQEKNSDNIKEYEEIHGRIGRITENFSGLSQRTRSLLDNEIRTLNQETENSLKKQGKLVADLIENFIRSNVYERMQKDLLTLEQTRQNKRFQEFVREKLPDHKEIEALVKESFPADQTLLMPYFENYLDESLIQAVEDKGYKLTIYIEGIIQSSAFKDENGGFISVPNANDLEVETAYEKIQDRHYLLTYRELKDSAGFEVGRIIVAFDIHDFMQEKEKRNAEIARMETDFNNLISGQEILKQEVTDTGANLFKRFGHMKRVIQSNLALLEQSLDEITSHEKQMFQISIIVLICALVLVSLFSAYAASSAAKSIHRVIEKLTRSSDGIVDISKKISETGRTLSRGASEQAAVSEQTAASLEEISSMSQQNTGSALKAELFTEDIKTIMETVRKSADQQIASMESISQSGEESAAIIKTISDIAFQTNLLSLNASVEAARAGETGAGFAVVAGEVRNLAMRTADAAKNTSRLIGDSVKRIKNGVDLSFQSRDDFVKLAEITSKIAGLIAEIADGSRSQTESLEQISRSTVQLDQVVQNNAAFAEENEQVSGKLNSQVERMQDAIGLIQALVRNP